jgi:hypothetical protein
MPKHPYTIGCECKRCVREAARREAQRRTTNRGARAASLKPRCATREEQRARYLDCGPAAWDDRD